MKKKTLILAVVAFAAVFATSCHKDDKDDAGVSFRDLAPVLKDMGMAVTEIAMESDTVTIGYDNGRVSRLTEVGVEVNMSWTGSGCTIDFGSESLSYSFVNNILTMKTSKSGKSMEVGAVCTFDGKHIVSVSPDEAYVSRYTWENGNLVRAVSVSTDEDGTLTTDSDIEYTYSDDVSHWDGVGLIQTVIFQVDVPGLNMFPVRNLPSGYIEHDGKVDEYHSFEYEIDSKGRIRRLTETVMDGSPDAAAKKTRVYSLKYGLK